MHISVSRWLVVLFGHLDDDHCRDEYQKLQQTRLSSVPNYSVVNQCHQVFRELIISPCYHGIHMALTNWFQTYFCDDRVTQWLLQADEEDDERLECVCRVARVLLALDRGCYTTLVEAPCLQVQSYSLILHVACHTHLTD